MLRPESRRHGSPTRNCEARSRQFSASNPARAKKAPPAPLTGDSQGLNYGGDVTKLRIYAEGPSARLYVEDSKAGRRLFWTMRPGSSMKPQLIFSDPPFGKFPPIPKKIFVSRKPLAKVETKRKGEPPFSIWRYPDTIGPKGMYAQVWPFQAVTSVRPLFWWGLSKEQDFDELSDEEIAKGLTNDTGSFGLEAPKKDGKDGKK